MKLEILLSTLNFDKRNFNNMNISTKCIIVNECDIERYEKYKNAHIYNITKLGTSISRNYALSKASSDIVLFCDDDVVYEKNFEKIVIDEFEKNKDADIIFFNLKSNREYKENRKSKRLHFYNILRYGCYNMAVRRDSLGNIRFNELFGGNSIYGSGEDTLFIVDAYKNKLKLYSSKEYIGEVNHVNSSWFNGYNEKYFFDKGALFCAINKNMRFLLCIQYLFRYKRYTKEIGFSKAFKMMINGCNDYLKRNN